jgi:hypothetical protein
MKSKIKWLSLALQDTNLAQDVEAETTWHGTTMAVHGVSGADIWKEHPIHLNHVDQLFELTRAHWGL